jgi:RsiW-degrading membrane proteinase PrsW (M82 family)
MEPEVPKQDAPPTIAEGIVWLFVRLFRSAAIAVVLLVFAMVSGFFRGQGLFVLVWVAIIAAPIWALAPLFRAIAGRLREPERSDR